jgi:hypothetical protein
VYIGNTICPPLVMVNRSVIVIAVPIDVVEDVADLNVKSPETLYAPLGIAIEVADRNTFVVDVLVVRP